MNFRKISPRALLTSFLVAGFSFPAQAAIITKDISVTIDSGSLVPNTYTGFFSYDDDTLITSPSFTGDIPIESFAFNFAGVDYDENDGDTALVVFDMGNFLGIDFVFSGSPEFSFLLGISNVSEASFSYSDGFGSVTFNTIPEPATFLGLVSLGLLGLVGRVRS
jgi:hypothetical protein